MAFYNFDPVVNKLIMLYILDKMEIPLTEYSIVDICTNKNEWLNYMDCKEILWQLLEVKFIYNAEPENRESRYQITYDGRSCLGHYFQRIPPSLREEISNFAKEERMNFKRNQEYVASYDKMDDGSYKATFQIKDGASSTNILTLELKVAERSQAISACKKWKNFAPKTYGYLVDNLFDDN